MPNLSTVGQNIGLSTDHDYQAFLSDECTGRDGWSLPVRLG